MSSIQNLLNQIQQGYGSLDQAHIGLAEAYNVITHLLEENEKLKATQYKQRTEKQSSSRWVYLQQMADAFNEAGIERERVVEVIQAHPRVDGQNSKETMYYSYWLPVQKAMYPGVKRLNTEQVQKVYDALNKHSSLNFGIGFDWPSKENQMNQQLGRR